MSGKRLLAILFIPLLTLTLSRAGESKADTEAIQGTWEVESAVYDGKQAKFKGRKTVWAIDKSHVSFSFDERHEYKLRPNKSSKWIDIVVFDDGKPSARLHGIYLLQGDSLKICLGDAKKKRPAQFQSKAGSGHDLFTLKRLSRKVKKWPEPEKTFGKREKPEFIKAPKTDVRAIVSNVQAAATQVRVLTISGNEVHFVYTLAFSPDGKILASGNATRGLYLWDVKTGRPIASLRGHAKDISAVVFSPNGKIPASASYDMTIDFWDNQTEKHITTLYPRKGSIGAIAFCPTGKVLASAGTLTIHLWEVPSGKLISTLARHKAKISCIAFSPDGKVIVSAGEDKAVRLWNVQTGRQIAVLQGHTEAVSSVSFTRDGELLATAGRDKTIRLWRFKTRKHIATLKGHTNWVTSISFSPDGTMLASASTDQTVRLWAVKTQQITRTLTGHKGFVTSVTFDPDGRRLASGGWDYQIKIWELRPKK